MFPWLVTSHPVSAVCVFSGHREWHGRPGAAVWWPEWPRSRVSPAHQQRPGCRRAHQRSTAWVPGTLGQPGSADGVSEQGGVSFCSPLVLPVVRGEVSHLFFIFFFLLTFLSLHYPHIIHTDTVMMSVCTHYSYWHCNLVVSLHTIFTLTL